MRRGLSLIIAGAALLAASCETIENKPTYVGGMWGGEHIGIIFQGGLAEVKFDCAAGTIDDPIRAADGPFMAKGSYRAGAAGPVRVGQIFRSQRATYSGAIARNVITLSVQLEDDGTTLGPFTLTEGQPPQITRCL
jgi:hypothetical protein